MFELSTTVVKVDVKVISASLTQNQCLHCAEARTKHEGDRLTRCRVMAILKFSQNV